MKNLCILSLFLMSSIGVSAQEWAPVGTEWYYEHTYAFSGTIDVNHWVSVGDTIINGQNCRIIEKDKGICAARPKRDFMYGENRRIYFFNEETQNFEVLYDFNLQTGETYVIPMWFEDPSSQIADSVIVTIDSVSTFVWNDSIYKKQFCSYSSDWLGPWNFEAIENIGGTLSMYNFNLGFCDGEFDGPLRCYNSEETGLINFGTVACDFTPIEDLNLSNEIIIYPNPVSGFLSIDYESRGLENLDFQLFNLSGQQILTGKLQNRYDQIDLMQLPEGIYFIHMLKEGDSIHTEKLVKMK